MTGPAINSTLMVAALDLNLVQLLRSAINTPDPVVAASAAGTGFYNSANSSGHAAQQTVNRSAGVRNCDCPAATFTPSRVPEWHARLNAMQPAVGDRPVMPIDLKPSIQLPWRTLPWPVAARAITSCSHSPVKQQLFLTDISDVGRTLDLFI